tara:strand:- start:27400 stop:28257 length:858 start_codon:yes stop_codon:yes gene_type:complete
MKNILIICLLFFSTEAFCKKVQIENNIGKRLNGFHYTNAKSKSIALILHGTRGHQNLELITSLGSALLENNIDSLSVNLSYGIDNRANDFLPCDIKHKHLQSDSINEIKLWFNYIQKLGYEKIYLIGHSRGGLNIMQFYHNLNTSDKLLVNSIFLIAPISDFFHNTRKTYEKKYNIDITKIKKENYKILKIEFLGCADTEVSNTTFLDYYDIDSENSLIGLLQLTNQNIYIITASEDTFVPNTYKRIQNMKKKQNIKLIMIEDADHFFRDFYFDDLIDVLLDKIK